MALDTDRPQPKDPGRVSAGYRLIEWNGEVSFTVAVVAMVITGFVVASIAYWLT